MRPENSLRSLENNLTPFLAGLRGSTGWSFCVCHTINICVSKLHGLYVTLISGPVPDKTMLIPMLPMQMKGYSNRLHIVARFQFQFVYTGYSCFASSLHCFPVDSFFDSFFRFLCDIDCVFVGKPTFVSFVLRASSLIPRRN